MAAVVGQECCCPSPTTFYVQDNLKSWSGGDVKILDGNQGLAFTVDAKACSSKQLRVLKDAQGKPICSMKQKVWSWKQTWTIYGGAKADSSMQIAKVSRDAKFMKYGTLHIQLTNDDQCAYTLQASGGWTGTRDVDLMFHGQVIGHARLKNTASAIFLNKNCYEVTINPGYDHAFLLCIIVIMNAYYHQYITVAAIA